MILNDRVAINGLMKVAQYLNPTFIQERKKRVNINGVTNQLELKSNHITAKFENHKTKLHNEKYYIRNGMLYNVITRRIQAENPKDES